MEEAEFVTWINEREHRLTRVDPELTLLQYLRSVGLTGTKLGCGEGGCGACTVVVGTYTPSTRHYQYISANACLLPLAACHERHVVTVEGIGSVSRPHRVQAAMAQDASQCGFCTPGFVMSLYAAWRNGELVAEKVEEVLDGNLCRCTGYRPIVDAARRVCAMGAACCQNRPDKASNEHVSADASKESVAAGGAADGAAKVAVSCRASEEASSRQSDNSLLASLHESSLESPHKSSFVSPDTPSLQSPNKSSPQSPDKDAPPLTSAPSLPASHGESQRTWEQGRARDATQELIFPPRLKLHLENNPHKAIKFAGERLTWYRPVTWDELLNLKQKYPAAKILNGNTEIGVEVKFKNMHYPVIIHGGDIAELLFIRDTEEGIEVGAGTRLNDLKRYCEAHMAEPRRRGLAAVHEMLRWFAGNQIRNVSSLAGNLATASPISDLNPVWAVLGAILTLASAERGERRLPVAEFFLGYRRTALEPDEAIKSLLIPWTRPHEHIRAYKQSKRRDDDISIVNAAFRVLLDGQGEKHRVLECAISYGGMGPTTLVSRTAAPWMVGKCFTDGQLMESFYPVLQSEFCVPTDAVGGMSEYRNALVPSLFFRFYLQTCVALGVELDDSLLTATEERLPGPPSLSSQYYPPVNAMELVGQPIPHLSALKHSTGNAQYLDDMPRQTGELYAGLVLSSKAHATIRWIDVEEALAVPGVEDIVLHSDVPSDGANVIGPVVPDERVFVEDTVTACGQIIAIVLATDQRIAQRAAKLVKVDLQELPPILTIDEAIRANSFHSPTRRLTHGHVDDLLARAPVTVTGSVYIGGQEHFYLETQAALVIPRPEDSSMEIHSSTQNPTEGQHFVAKTLNIPAHKVQCHVRRIGGGFGGKETRSSFLIAALAVAARKSGRAVRCMMDRDEDMLFSGQRHPFKAEYRLGVSEEGMIMAADVQLFANGGHSLDLSLGVMERAMSHFDNCYRFPALRITGRICKTNLPSNTAFRGFGGPQAMFFCETMLTQAAQVLGMCPETIRRRNLYREGDHTHFGMTLENVPLTRLWRQLEQDCEFARRRAETDQYNRTSRWKKRGLALLPTKFGIGFGVRFLNQAGALVHVYSDGSVLLAHGGVEMGQGLHTKMCQIAAEALGAPLAAIHFEQTSTTTVPNTSPSAASASSDLNGMAVLDACRQISQRLEPLRATMPRASFAEIAQTAYLQRIDLSARGFYATPGLGFDWDRQEGRLFNYFTFGAACSEVELDVLTGDHQVLRSDLLMDLGRSLNPVVDVGQIEGAFTQGLGLFTLEQPLYLRSGMMLNRGPGGYKIPTASDVPRQFRVALFEASRNERAVHGSKAVGEPPLFLAASVFFALHDAVLAARRDAQREQEKKQDGGTFDTTALVMDSPATAERLRLACGDVFLRPTSTETTDRSEQRPFDGRPINPRDNPNAWCIEV